MPPESDPHVFMPPESDPQVFIPPPTDKRVQPEGPKTLPALEAKLAAAPYEFTDEEWARLRKARENRPLAERVQAVGTGAGETVKHTLSLLGKVPLELDAAKARAIQTVVDRPTAAGLAEAATEFAGQGAATVLEGLGQAGQLVPALGQRTLDYLSAVRVNPLQALAAGEAFPVRAPGMAELAQRLVPDTPAQEAERTRQFKAKTLREYEHAQIPTTAPGELLQGFKPLPATAEAVSIGATLPVWEAGAAAVGLRAAQQAAGKTGLSEALSALPKAGRGAIPPVLRSPEALAQIDQRLLQLSQSAPSAAIKTEIETLTSARKAIVEELQKPPVPVSRLRPAAVLSPGERATEAAGRVAEVVGTAARTTGALPRKAAEKVISVVTGPEYAGRAAKYLEAAGLVYHPVVQLVGALEASGVALQKAGQLFQHLARSNSALGRFYAVAQNTEAPAWMRRLLKTPIARGTEKAASYATHMAKGGLEGTTAGLVFGAVTGSEDEELGADIAGMGLFGLGARALSLPHVHQMRFAKPARAKAIELVLRNIENGATPEALAKVADFTFANMAGFETIFPEWKIQVLDQAAYDAKTVPQGGKGTAGATDFASKTIFLNADSPRVRTPDMTFLHELFHPAWMTEVVNRPDLRVSVDALLSKHGLTIEEAKLRYMTRLLEPQHPNLTPEQVAELARRAVADRDAQVTAGEAQAGDWIYSELLAEGSIRNLWGKRLLDVAAPSLVSRMAEKLGKEPGGTVPARFRPATFFADPFKAVLDDPAMGKLVRGTLRKQAEFVPGLTEAAVQEAPLRTEDMGGPKAPFYPTADGKAVNPYGMLVPDGKGGSRFVAFTNRQRKQMERAEKRAMKRYVQAGQRITALPAEFYTDPNISPWTKEAARKLGTAIQAGEALEGHYHRLNARASTITGDWRSEAARTLGNTQVSWQEFHPIALFQSKAGNILADVYSIAAIKQKLALWGSRKGALSLDRWNGDPAQFMRDLDLYIRNHQADLPGESNNLGVEKRNIINAFLFGKVSKFAENNPLRADLRGADRAGIIRSLRLDRLETLQPHETTLPRPEYEFGTQNFSPSTDPDAVKLAAVRDREGNIYEGAMHALAALEYWNKKFPGDDINALRAWNEVPELETGWVTNKGEFLTRDQAFERAVDKGQYTPTKRDVDRQLESTAFEHQQRLKEAGYEPARVMAEDTFSPLPETKVAGDEVTKPAHNYRLALQTGGNPWVRRTTTPTESNADRLLMVQFSSDLIQKSAKDEAGTYYDKLYSGTRPGYARLDDFWEIPQWMGYVAHVFPNADVYVVRDMAQAKQFLNSANYGRVAMSALDVNKHLVRELVKDYPGHVDLGGYVEKGTFSDLANVKWHDNVKSLAADAGVPYSEGVDYRHFAGSDVIPRLTMSTGCRHKCAFCAVEKTLSITPKEVIEQQADAIAGLGAKLVYLNDKTFGQAGNYKALSDIYQRIKRRVPDFKGFIVQTTAAQLKAIPADWLKQSGIKFVELGVETFNDPLLREMHKPATEKLIDEVTDKLRQNGIILIPNIIIGLPGETPQTYQNTLNWLARNKDVISHANIYNLALYKDAELGKKMTTATEGDFNENVLEKSWHTDPDVHRAFAGEVYGAAQRMLDNTFEYSPKPREKGEAPQGEAPKTPEEFLDRMPLVPIGAQQQRRDAVFSPPGAGEIDRSQILAAAVRHKKTGQIGEGDNHSDAMAALIGKRLLPGIKSLEQLEGLSDARRNRAWNAVEQGFVTKTGEFKTLAEITPTGVTHGEQLQPPATQAKPFNPEELKTPAVIDTEGRVYEDVGHAFAEAEAYNRGAMPRDPEEGFDRGYVDHRGKFLTREQVIAKVKAGKITGKFFKTPSWDSQQYSPAIQLADGTVVEGTRKLKAKGKDYFVSGLVLAREAAKDKGYTEQDIRQAKFGFTDATGKFVQVDRAEALGVTGEDVHPATVGYLNEEGKFTRLKNAPEEVKAQADQSLTSPVTAEFSPGMKKDAEAQRDKQAVANNRLFRRGQRTTHGWWMDPDGNLHNLSTGEHSTEAIKILKIPVDKKDRYDAYSAAAINAYHSLAKKGWRAIVPQTYHRAGQPVDTVMFRGGEPSDRAATVLTRAQKASLERLAIEHEVEIRNNLGDAIYTPPTAPAVGETPSPLGGMQYSTRPAEDRVRGKHRILLGRTDEKTGETEGYPSKGEFTHADYNMGGWGMPWRFNPVTKQLFWWAVPEEVSSAVQEAAKSWLGKKGYDTENIKTSYINAEAGKGFATKMNLAEYAAAHGISKQEAIKQLEGAGQAFKEIAYSTRPAEQETLSFGGKKLPEFVNVGNLTIEEIRKRFPEAVQVRTRDDKVEYGIAEAPLVKGMDEAAAVKAYAGKLVAEAKKWSDDPVFKSGLRWYSEFVPMLKKQYGKSANLMAQLLAATSPRANPGVNWGFAEDALYMYQQGRFKKQLVKYEQGLKMLDNGTLERWYNVRAKKGLVENAPEKAGPGTWLSEWVDAHDLYPRQSNGQRYGMRSGAVLEVLAGVWLEKNQGLKVNQFVKNLLGTHHGATVDVWAARTMRRLGYEGLQDQWRILPMNETSVSDKDFRFSQEVFAEAAKSLGVKPDALQGAMWFAEKQHWNDQGWSPMDLGDFRREAKKAGMIRQRSEQRLKEQTQKPQPAATQEQLF